MAKTSLQRNAIIDPNVVQSAEFLEIGDRQISRIRGVVLREFTRSVIARRSAFGGKLKAAFSIADVRESDNDAPPDAEHVLQDPLDIHHGLKGAQQDDTGNEKDAHPTPGRGAG